MSEFCITFYQWNDCIGEYELLGVLMIEIALYISLFVGGWEFIKWKKRRGKK